MASGKADFPKPVRNTLWPRLRPVSLKVMLPSARPTIQKSCQEYRSKAPVELSGTFSPNRSPCR